MKRIRAGVVALLVVRAATAAPPTDAELQSRARLVWVLGDDDVLRPPSTTTAVSRGFGVGDRAGYGAFYDGLAARDDGRESWLELGYSRRAPASFAGVETWAALAIALRLDGRLTSANAPPLEDRDSKIGLSLERGESRGSLEVFPFDSDAIRLGSLRELSWGGTRSDRAESSFPGAEPGVPAARGALHLAHASLFVALKLATPRDPEDAAPLLGVLLGGAWDATPQFRLSGGLGRIAHPSLAARGGPEARGFAAAANLRVVVHVGGVDDARAPGAFSAFRLDTPASDRTGWALALEATGLLQRLADSAAPVSSRLEPARAVALQAELAGAGLDSALAVSLRELAFVVRHGPGLFPQQALPPGVSEPELGAAVSTAVTAWAPLVPELSLGLRLPATWSPGRGSDVPPVVVRGTGDLALLAPGSRRVPLLEARAGLQWRASELLVLGAFGSYRRDNNATVLVRSSEGLLVRRFASPDFLGGGFTMRAEF